MLKDFLLKHNLFIRDKPRKINFTSLRSATRSKLLFLSLQFKNLHLDIFVKEEIHVSVFTVLSLCASLIKFAYYLF